LIALAVTTVIVVAAWFVGRDRSVPGWIENWLVPGLGWLGLFLIIIAVASEVRKRL
jgi:hypothetical protein